MLFAKFRPHFSQQALAVKAVIRGGDEPMEA